MVSTVFKILAKRVFARAENKFWIFFESTQQLIGNWIAIHPGLLFIHHIYHNFFYNSYPTFIKKHIHPSIHPYPNRPPQNWSVVPGLWSVGTCSGRLWDFIFNKCDRVCWSIPRGSNTGNFKPLSALTCGSVRCEGDISWEYMLHHQIWWGFYMFLLTVVPIGFMWHLYIFTYSTYFPWLNQPSIWIGKYTNQPSHENPMGEPNSLHNGAPLPPPTHAAWGNSINLRGKSSRRGPFGVLASDFWQVSFFFSRFLVHLDSWDYILYIDIYIYIYMITPKQGFGKLHCFDLS